MTNENDGAVRYGTSQPLTASSLLPQNSDILPMPVPTHIVRFQPKKRNRKLSKRDLVDFPASQALSSERKTEPQTLTSTNKANEYKTTREKLFAQIRASDDTELLTGTLVPRLCEAIRIENDALMRGDLMNAVSTRFKELSGRKLSRGEIGALFPKSSPMSSESSSMPISEFGVTERLKAAHGHELMFASDSNCWYLFNDGCWRQEANAVRVVEKARAIVKTLRPLAEAISDEYLRAQTLRKVDACERTSFARGVVAGLAGEDGIVTDSLELDAHAELLGVPNGIVALRTGALLPPDPSARITLSTACNFIPGAKAPWFEQTVFESFEGNVELIDFLKRLMGYTLLACPNERLVIIPLGGGRNGKSTIFNAIADTLGTHGGKMGAETIASPSTGPQSSNPGGPREDLLRLRGKRIVLSGEIRRGTTFNDNTIKELASGGDIITARGLFSKSSVEFRPTCVVVAPTNTLPDVRDDDPAVWDRLLLLPFNQRFGEPGKPPIDLQRAAKLHAECEGILAWLVEGALEYQRVGLNVPSQIQGLKHQLREGNSPISLFIKEYCLTGPQYATATKDLFAAWKRCAAEQGERHVAQTAISFGRALSSHSTTFISGLVQTEEGRLRGWRGIQLKDGKASLIQCGGSLG